MNSKTEGRDSTWVWIWICATLLVIALFGCGASKLTVAAQTTTSIASLSLTAAEAFNEVDRQKIAKITDELKRDRDWEKATIDRDAWDAQATKAKQAFLVLNLAVQSTREAISLAQQGKNVNFLAELDKLMKVFVSLKDTLKAFNINLPTGGL